MVEQVATGSAVNPPRSGEAGLTGPAGPAGSAGSLRSPGAAVAHQSRLRTGRYGEDLATAYLEDIGWQILERNWRPDHGLRGELDIIALDPAPGGQESEPGSAPGDGGKRRRRPALVIVEVKTRSSLCQGPPAAAVDARKLARLRALGAAWVSTHEGPHAGLRIDVVSILLREERPALLCHHRAVGTSWG